jgi:hypothetical protein
MMVMMRQKQDNFKRQQYLTFSVLFICVPLKINSSAHQTEITMYQPFLKADSKELDRLVKEAVK